MTASNSRSDLPPSPPASADDIPRPARVLLVIDDPRLGTTLSEILTSHGFEVAHERNGTSAAERLVSEPFDLGVLDLVLPGASGFEVCRRTRERFRGALVLLAGPGGSSDHVTALELGADDVVTKPVDARVLVARLRNLVRRAGRVEGGPGPSRIALGALVIDRELRTARVGDRRVDLTGSEFGILWMLAENAGSPVTREALHMGALGTRWNPMDRGLDAHVSRIRRKLAACRFDPSALQSVRGEGYRLLRR